MEAIVDAHNVVVSGAWNRRLFTPQWIKEEFAGASDVLLELAIGNPSVPILLSYAGLKLQVSNDRLIVSGSEASDVELKRVQEFMSGILSRLKHTPVIGVGINFQWNAPEPDPPLLGLFDLPDNQRLADNGVVIESVNITRSTVWKERVLNLRLNLTTSGTVECHVNFHSDATSTKVAKEHVDGDLVALRNEAKEILASAYELEF